jgi:hypothetical protein
MHGALIHVKLKLPLNQIQALFLSEEPKSTRKKLLQNYPTPFKYIYIYIK